MNEELKMYREIAKINQRMLSIEIGASAGYIASLERKDAMPNRRYALAIMHEINRRFTLLGYRHIELCDLFKRVGTSYMR